MKRKHPPEHFNKKKKEIEQTTLDSFWKRPISLCEKKKTSKSLCENKNIPNVQNSSPCFLSTALKAFPEIFSPSEYRPFSRNEPTHLNYHENQLPSHILHLRCQEIFDHPVQYQKTLVCSDDYRISLCEAWYDVAVAAGDLINIVDFLPSDSHEITLTDQRGLIIVNPHLLVSCTLIGGSFFCLRKTFLQERIQQVIPLEREEINTLDQAAAFGSIIHTFAESVLQNPNIIEHRQVLADLIESTISENIFELYSIKTTEAALKEKLLCLVPALSNFVRIYLRNKTPINDFTLEKFVDNEKHLWSFTYGIKGIIDVLFKDERLDHYLPVELKTGKYYISHDVQVILYSFLLSDAYGEKNTRNSGSLRPFPNNTQIDRIEEAKRRKFEQLRKLRRDSMAGALLYLRPGEEFELRPVPRRRMEYIHILKQRNLLSTYLCSHTLPPCHFDPFKCSNCSFRLACSLFPGCSSDEVENEVTSHLLPQDIQYFSKWHHLLTIENDLNEQFVSKYELFTQSSREREVSGNCLSQMEQSSEKKDDLVLTFSRSFCPLSCSFQPGDYVIISAEPSGPYNVASGKVISLSYSIPFEITLQLNRPFSSSATLFRVDLEKSSSRTGLAMGNLCSLLSNSPFYSRKRQLLIHGAPPRFNPRGRVLPPSDFSHLNEAQQYALNQTFCTKDYFLIQGMPGSGKSTLIACLMECLRGRQKKILFCSHTHNAIDNILMKLHVRGIPFLRIGQNPDPAKYNDLHPYILHHRFSQFSSVSEVEQDIAQTHIFASTCLAIANSVFQHIHFDYCIIDEASQLTEPECLGPLLLADVFVLVGDHFQLPPLVKNPEACHLGLNVSLFERLAQLHPEKNVELLLQYRMNADIMKLANQLIYNDSLQLGCPSLTTNMISLSTDLNHTWMLEVASPSSMVVFVDTDAIPAHERRDNGLKSPVYNPFEAIIILRLIEYLQIHLQQPESLAVISVYKKQIQFFHSLMKKCDFSPNSMIHPIDICTVDKFQGKEKSIVFVSLVRSNPDGQVGKLLQDWRRINVAFTRAQKKLIILGSSSTLRTLPLFEKFLSIMRENRWIYSLLPDAVTLG